MSTTRETDAIYQVYISDQNAEPPQLLHRAIASVQQCFSAYRYVRHNGDSLRAFIEQNFDREVVAAYDKLRPYSYKADLGRYCLLYQNGGWYADISIMMRSHVAAISADVDLIYFFDLGDGVVPGRSLFDVSNSLLYARPRQAALDAAIQSVVRHCQEEYYGTSIYCPTGPTVLGAAIASQPRSQRHVSGHLMPLTPNHRQRNLSFVLPDGSILALFKKGWMKPGEVLFGKIEGTNNYVNLWNERRVYRQDKS